MKLFKYELTEWTRTLHNFWRFHNYDPDTQEMNFAVGLIVNDSNASLSEQFWQVDFIHEAHPAVKCIMPLIRSSKRYRYHEIGRAKQDVDKFIIKMNNLKSFL